MVLKIKEILDTDVVFLNERQRKIIFSIITKILKSNIFIFFVLGTIVSIIEWNRINWDSNYYWRDSLERIDFVYSTIISMLIYHFMPFYAAIILNFIIKFSKNKIVKKVFKIIMIITNVLSVIYLLLWAFLWCFLELPPQS